MTSIESDADTLRNRALTLAPELGVDSATWYVRMLEASRRADTAPDLGALVRAYWELQLLSGRPDLRDEWRRLADALWQDDAA
jgi:hypothetical protein